MVQLEILSGKKAGSSWDARRFPVRVGRSANSDLQLEEPGVWDDHLKISLAPTEGFVVETQASAVATINGQPGQRVVLRNGDTIEMGSIKLQFWLSKAPQRGQAVREAFVWTLITLVCLAQIALVYWLLQED
ncbi:MAG TPA: FHA domain-containing protein [Verrucomicrobiae bacterium]|jgi:predicted component of type VI protein secretion system|nr:FHA domain-containing protein [Verrucomicrobiae bacterium]